MSKAKELYESAVIYLIRHERFYYEMLSRMNKIYTKDSNFVPTAGVEITTNGINLHLNEYFVQDQTVEGLAAILIHECEHPMRNHFNRAKAVEPSIAENKKDTALDNLKKSGKFYNLNLAEDYAINQNIKGLPKKFRVFDGQGNPLKNENGEEIVFSPAMIDDLVEAYPDKKIKYFQAMEYYYNILKEETEQQTTSDNSIVVSIDSHEILDQSLQKIDSEFAKNIINKTVNDSKNALSDAEAGNLPSHIKVLIEKLNAPQINWRQALRVFKSSCNSSDIEDTRKRRNRRYGIQYPGKRVKDTSHIAVAIDSSGSIMEKELTQFLSEIHAMVISGVKITYIECDSMVQCVEAFNPKAKPEIKGRGGTLFKPVFDLVQTADFKKKYGKINGLIYFTDGDNFDTDLQQPNFKTLWALLPKGKSNYEWGQKITIKLESDS